MVCVARPNNTAVTTFNVDSKNQLTNVTGLGNRSHDGNCNATYSPSVSYEYDAENQVVRMSSGQSWKFTFVYDGRGRLRLRQNYTYVHPYGHIPTDTLRYTYDRMRVIQERIGDFPFVSYTRGTDLSGSLEGAGGIGGMLARSDSYSSGTGNWSSHSYYHADGNGNITCLLDSSQAKVATYKYDPYGNTISSGGTLAAANTYRFSSKEINVNSGLYYYGYRWYEPNLQRWLNRDPIAELGFVWLRRQGVILNETPNLYSYVQNNPIIRWDALGLCPGECFNASPEDSNSNVCSQYGKRKYLGVDMSCFCRCAGNSDWSNYVRGCLACMDSKGVSDTTAHITCYEAADKKYSRPNIRIALCTAACK